MKTSEQVLPRTFPHMPIVRPTKTDAVRGLILTDRPLLFHVHMYKGRTVPCDGPLLCSLCSSLAEKQRIYLPLHAVDSKKVFVDLPASHYEWLLGRTEKYGSLLGLDLIARRRRPADNAPIALHVDDKWRANHQPIPAYSEYIAHLDHILYANKEFAIEQYELKKNGSRE